MLGRYDSRDRLVALREQNLVPRLYLFDEVGEVGGCDFFGYGHGSDITAFPVFSRVAFKALNMYRLAGLIPVNP